MVLIWRGWESFFWQEYFPTGLFQYLQPPLLVSLDQRIIFKSPAKKFLRGLAHYQLEWHHWLMKDHIHWTAGHRTATFGKSGKGRDRLSNKSCQRDADMNGSQVSRHMTIPSIWKIRCQKAKGAENRDPKISLPINLTYFPTLPS